MDVQIFTDEDEAQLQAMMMAVSPQNSNHQQARQLRRLPRVVPLSSPSAYPPLLTTLRIHRDISADLLAATIQQTKRTLRDLEIWKMTNAASATVTTTTMAAAGSTTTSNIKKVCLSLSHHPSLQKVLLNTSENMKDRHVADLFGALTTCSKLQSLILYRSWRREFGGSGSSNGKAGGESWPSSSSSLLLPIEELCSMPRLETLITDLKFDNQTSRELFRCLQCNTTLKRLRVGVNATTTTRGRGRDALDTNNNGIFQEEDDQYQDHRTTTNPTNSSGGGGLLPLLSDCLIEMLNNNVHLESLDIEGLSSKSRIRTIIDFYLLLNLLGRKNLRKRSPAKLLDFIITNHHNPKVTYFFLLQHPDIIMIQNNTAAVVTTV